MTKTNEIDDGVIKFDLSKHLRSQPIPDVEYSLLESYRKNLYGLKLIGEYKDHNIGYGNLSTKQDYRRFKDSKRPQFLISGTQTGKLQNLSGSKYVRILSYDLQLMSLDSMGPIFPSSESLTHAAIYEANKKIKVVFHIHHPFLWKKMLKLNYILTPKEIPYGTKEMAEAVKQRIKNLSEGIIVMAGHEDGIIIFAESLEKCWEMTKSTYDKFIFKEQDNDDS